MKFFNLQSQVAALDYGEKTVYTDSEYIDVEKLHIEFERWPQDDLQCCQYCFIGTERLKQALERLSPPVTGVEFCPVEVSGDDQEFDRVWRKGRPDSALGEWYWFKITGKPGVHDFGQEYRSLELIVSERVLAEVEKFPLPYKRDFQPWGGEIEAGRVPQKGAPAEG